MRNSSHKCSVLWLTGPPLVGYRPDIAGSPQAGRARLEFSHTHRRKGCHLINVIVVTLARFLHKRWASLFTVFFLGVVVVCLSLNFNKGYYKLEPGKFEWTPTLCSAIWKRSHQTGKSCLFSFVEEMGPGSEEVNEWKINWMQESGSWKGMGRKGTTTFYFKP